MASVDVSDCARQQGILEWGKLRGYLRGGWENTKQLSEGGKWRRILELYTQTSDILKVLCERGIVIRVVPVPSWNTLVIVFQHPT